MIDRRKDLTRLAIALALPLVVLLVLIGRGAFITQSGKKWRVRISGYDPRDLVHGHYLRYRFNWKWIDRADSAPLTSEDTSGGKFFCLTPFDAEGLPEPSVRIVDRDDRTGCKSWFPVETEESLRRFYIPENRGAVLERALRDKTCYVVLAVSSIGQVVVDDLLIGDTTWSEALKNP